MLHAPPLRSLPFRLLAACGTACVVACSPAAEQASAPTDGADAGSYQAPAVAPLYSINEVMVGVVDHAAHVLWDVGREGMAPATDHDWEELEHHAIQLVAAGTLITVGGTGAADNGWVRQIPWQQQAQAVRDGGQAALEAARARNLQGVLDAGDRLVEACESCHKEYKPDMPSEGIYHPHGGG